MKKSLIALAALAATSAFAQSTVTLSGSAGFAYEQASAGGDATLTNPDVTTTTVAMSGSEDLGGGLKANFYMQQRLNGMTGANIATGGRTMQNVYVGVSGGFGSVIVGRFATASASGYDAFAGFGNTGADYGVAYSVTVRADSTIQYTTPNFNGFSATVATTKDTTLATQYVYLNAGYTAGPISATYYQERNTTGFTDRTIGASYDFKVAKAMVIWAKTGGAVETTNTSIGVRAPLGAATTLKAQFRSGDAANAFAMGVDYALSKRTRLYADFGSVDGAVQNAYRLGLQHSF